MSSFLLLGAGTDASVGGGSSVSSDAVSTWQGPQTDAGAWTFNYTLGATANLIVVGVGCETGGAFANITSVVWDAAGVNQSFTAFDSEPNVSASPNGPGIAIYTLKAPSSSGTKLITFNGKNSGQAFVYFVSSFIGTNGTTPITTSAKGNSTGAVASYGPPSAGTTLTTATGHLGLILEHGDFQLSSSFSTSTTGTTGTVVSHADSAANGRSGYMIGGVGTNDLTITLVGGNDTCCGIAMDISP